MAEQTANKLNNSCSRGEPLPFPVSIKNTEELVYKILFYKPRARTDDFILYGCVLAQCNIDLNMSMKDFLLSAKKLKFPPFATVTRCRRKLQEKYPYLKDEKTAVFRAWAEQKFRNINMEENT